MTYRHIIYMNTCNSQVRLMAIVGSTSCSTCPLLPSPPSCSTSPLRQQKPAASFTSTIVVPPICNSHLVSKLYKWQIFSSIIICCLFLSIMSLLWVCNQSMAYINIVTVHSIVTTHRY